MKVLNLTLNGIDADKYNSMTQLQKINFIAKRIKKDNEETANLLGYEYKCERVSEPIEEVDPASIAKPRRTRSSKKRKSSQDS